MIGVKSSISVFDSSLDDDVFFSDMAWIKPEHTRGKVDAAGNALARAPFWTAERDEALSIINNWRSSHAYPLQCLKMTLLNRAKRINGDAVVAQRIKRLSSIASKLERNEGMKLSRMHDIGGCRAVMGDVGQVHKLVQLYEESNAKNPFDRPEFVRKYDYITEPKTDGYRSVHLVYRYRSISQKHKAFNGLRIEIQIRSQLQHAWATAVETVSTFTGQALKSNIGDESWKRFFALMGSAIALREGCPTVPGTPGNKNELVDELKALVQKLRVLVVLGGWTATVKMAKDEMRDAQAFLLVLDTTDRTVEVTTFRRNELADASEQYLLVEKKYASRPDVQAVLVSVDSIAALQSAYPNYYLDTRAFLDAVTVAVSS